MHLFCRAVFVLQFSRTVAPETSKGPALIAFMRQNGWTKAVILASTYGAFFESGLGLTKQLQAAKIEVHKSSAFEPGKFNSATLRDIKRSGFRIVTLLAQDNDVIAIASSTDQKGMSSAGYAWILIGTVGTEVAFLRMAGWLWLRPLLPSDGMQAFAEEVSYYAKSRFNFTVSADSVDLTYSMALHDAIMLYAHAATKVLSEGGDLHDGRAVTAAVRSTTIKGVGGSVVALDQSGDRNESYEVMNYVKGADSGMSSVPVGMYSNTLHQYMAYERAVIWPGSTTDVPADFFLGGCVLSCPPFRLMINGNQVHRCVTLQRSLSTLHC